MKPESKQYQVEVGGKTLIFETGTLAEQAGGAVTVRLGDSVMFCAATMGDPRPINFFPLTIDYEERLYAGGRIPGSFFRREGRPTENAILTARLTDRPLRPLFPKDMRNEVQVILYSFSADGENLLDILALNAASTAVMISDIPWNGPVGAVRVGRVEGEFVINPTYAELEESDLDLRLAGTREAILMVEAGALEVSEEVMVEALEVGHKAIQPIIDLQLQMVAELGKEKREYPPVTIEETLLEDVFGRTDAKLQGILDQTLTKGEQVKATNALRDEIVEAFTAENAEITETEIKDIKEAFYAANKKVVRSRILDEGKRPDGRQATDVRAIWSEIEISPKAHGSGLFTRGSTQVLTVAALGTPREAQIMDNLTPVETKRFIHHYNFPPFSVGEARFLRGASRREIGHGLLAERALMPVIPPEDEFPYTIRLVSECLSSNGSTSMGSVCGSTLALMDTGVPIKAPVSGIAMGLIKEGDNYAILSDIQGMEDHLGDMDFKVAGTDKGITALQMDIKISGVTREIMTQALAQAKEGRSHILNKMLETISAPRPELKPHVPRITTIKVPIEKIGAIIGPGGKNIRALQEETNTKIDIGDDGTVFIAAVDGEGEAAARERIAALTESPEIGRIYTGKVVRTTDFGAFVEILPGTDGLVHISQLDSERVEKVEDIARLGEEITVMVTNIDPMGKVRLSRQAVLEGWTAEEARERDKPKRSSGGGRRQGGRRGGGDRNRNRR